MELEAEEYKRRNQEFNKKIEAKQREIEKLKRAGSPQELFVKLEGLINIFGDRCKLHHNQGIREGVEADLTAIRDLFLEQNALVKKGLVKLSKHEAYSFQRALDRAIAAPYMHGEISGMQRKRKRSEQEKLKHEEEMQKIIRSLKRAATPKETKKRVQRYLEDGRAQEQKKKPKRGKR